MKLCDLSLAKRIKNGQSAYLVAHDIINYEEDYSEQRVFPGIKQEKNGETGLPLSALPDSRHHQDELMLWCPSQVSTPKQSLTYARGETFSKSL